MVSITLSATPGDGQVTLTWVANLDILPSYYSINISSESLPETLAVDATNTETTKTIRQLPNGGQITNDVQYNFVIVALAHSTLFPSVIAPIGYSNTVISTPSAAPGGSVPCFPAGVRIRTPHGSAPVESLKSGDLILTADNRVVPIRMHSYSLEETSPATAPYFIPAGAMGPKAPAKPLHLSPLHAFQVRPNVWWCAKEAAKHSSKIQQYGLGEPITYYHVECPNFLRDNLVADGVVVESFAAKQLTQAQKHNLYKYSKKLGGFVRSNPSASTKATL